MTRDELGAALSAAAIVESETRPKVLDLDLDP
jgi:hypothetical protein